MTQFFTDFGEFSTGSLPAAFSNKWQGNTYTVEALTGSPSGNALKGTAGSNGERALSWDTPGTAADAEIVLRFKGDSIANTGTAFSAVVRGSGDTAGRTGYFLDLQYAGQSVRLVKLMSGASTVLGTSAYTWDNGEYIWLRLRANGTAIKGKVWKDSEQEPLTWTFEATDSDISAAGWIGTYYVRGTGDKYADLLGVGTAGDSAPRAEVRTPVPWLHESFNVSDSATLVGTHEWNEFGTMPFSVTDQAALVGGVTNVVGCAVCTTPLDSADHYVEASIARIFSGGDNVYAGLMVRADPDTGDGYYFYVRQGGSTGARGIGKIVNGVRTSLASAAGVVSGDIRLQAAGNVITAYMGETELLSVTDSTFTDNVHVGLFGLSTSSTSTYRLDNIYAATSEQTRIQVATGADDVYWTDANGFASNSSTVINGQVAGATIYKGAIRFTNVTIPQGATVDHATVELRPASSRTPTDQNHYFTGSDEDNAAAVASNADAVGRTRTAAQVDWVPKVWVAGTIMRSPNIAAILQEIVDRPGWVSGNSVVIFWENDGLVTNELRASSYETGTIPPALQFTYTPAGTTVNADITSDGYTSVGDFYSGAGYEELFFANADPDFYAAGLRVADLAVPADVTVTQATLTITVTSGGPVTATTYLEAADDPALPVTEQQFWARARTTANTVTSLTTAGAYNIDVTDQLQEVVSRTGWALNNAVLFLIEPSGNLYDACYIASEGRSSGGATLSVTYESGAPTTQDESGGSTATVTVDAEGAGTAAEVTSGGSTATVAADAQAGGSFREVAYWSEPEVITVGPSGGTLMPWLGAGLERPWEGVGPDTYLGVART